MTELDPAVIVDVDGTLVDVSGVRHYVQDNPRKKDFHHFHAGAELCPPIQTTLDLLKALRGTVNVLVVTSRKQQWEFQTRRWLRKHNIQYDHLYMRGNDDGRPDAHVKGDIYDTIRREYKVILAIDDNPSIVELWALHGIPTVVVPGWVSDAPTRMESGA